jgi:hypothetical protein
MTSNELPSQEVKDIQEITIPQDIQEISIALAAQNLNPTILSAEFLKFSGIVPSHWELEKQPLFNPAISQLIFTNGVNITAQPGNVTIAESLAWKKIKEVQSPELARKYLDKLPLAEYQGLTINIKSLVPIPGRQDAARTYMSNNLLSPGAWQEFGKAPVQVGLNLLYFLDLCQLSLTLNEARIQEPNKPPVAALWFSGNFNYNVSMYPQTEKVPRLQQLIGNWHKDLETFRELVYQKFLGQAYVGEEVSLFPSNDMF